MKIAYLISLYPAVSHTFIQREVAALRGLGLDIETFSVRRAGDDQVLGEAAETDRARTRWLVPGNVASYLAAFGWALGTRPLRLLRVLWEALFAGTGGLRQRVMWLLYFAEAVQLSHWLSRGRHTHLHVHFGNAGSNTGYLAALLAGIPFSLTLHGIDLDEPEKFRLPRKVALAKFVVCISQFGRSRLMWVTPQALWAKIHVVRNGFPLPPSEKIAPLPCSGSIVCVARLSVEKGHFVLLEALALLRERGLPFHCTLVGDGPLRAALESRTRALGLESHVHFSGVLPPDRVAEAYNRADVCVLASFGEGIPLVLTEALAHGRPVVATWVGGIPELVEHGVSGLLVAPGSAADLAEALARMFSDWESIGTAWGQAGRARVGAVYDTAAAAARLKALFEGP